MENSKYQRWLLPLKIIVIYAIVGALWILLSDQVLLYLVADHELILKFSVYKGWAYVAITSLLLYLLMAKDVGAIIGLNRALQEKNQALADSNRELQALYQQLYATEAALHENYDELTLYKEQLEAQTERYRLVIRASQEGFWDYQAACPVLDISPKAREIMGLGEGNIHLEDMLAHIYPDDLELFKSILASEHPDHIDGGITDIRILQPSGASRWSRIKWVISKDVDGHPTRYTGAIEDIHDAFLMTEKIKHLAFHDAATGFFNRDYLLEHLKARLNQQAQEVVVVVIAVAEFERITSLYGKNHAEIIHFQSGVAIRSAFGDEVIFGMLDQGKFCVIIANQPSTQTVTGYLQDALIKLNQHQEQALGYQELELHIAYAVGGCIASDGADAAEVLQNSEHACDHAKEIQNYHDLQWYTHEMSDSKAYRRLIESALKRALENGEMYLVYQPQHRSLEPGDIVGFEALLRWLHPQMGFVRPDVFIPIAEEILAIEAIGRFVIQSACSFASELSRAGYSSFNLAINASVIELAQSDYVDFLLDTIIAHGISPARIVIEITETSVSKFVDTVREHVLRLNAAGIQVHLDDFGTGYSSLNQVGTLPLSVIKIDRSFVSTLTTDPKMHHLTSLIIRMGHVLGLEVIAEGVETLEQYEALKAFKCDLYQGYLFNKPVPKSEVLQLLSASINRA